MPEPPIKSNIAQLLERLQEESWQLELLISGFAIFLVAGSFEPLEEWSKVVTMKAQGLERSAFIQVPIVVLLGMWGILLINLISHVVLRGFWIATIGLRYISGDIEFEVLDFAPRFDNYLRKRMPSFDDFIERLEKICSVVFAFTFLIIFTFLSIGLYVLFVSLVTNYLMPFMQKTFSESVNSIFIFFFISILSVTTLLYFIDFVSLGRLKKIKWLSVVYYPIYRFYSIITLSAIYRPLYYNLIDNKFGRRVGFLIVPYIIILMFATSMETVAFRYFPEFMASKVEIRNTYYVDNMDQKSAITNTCIPSKYIDNDYLEIFIPYKAAIDNEVEKLCPGIKSPKKIGTRFNVVQFGGNDEHSPVDSLLECVSMIYKLYIDSVRLKEDFLFHKHQVLETPGLISIQDIDTLSRGKHFLEVQAARSKRDVDSVWYTTIHRIPFWTR